MKMYDYNGELTNCFDEAMYLYFEDSDEIDTFIYDDYYEELTYYLIKELKYSTGGWFYYATDSMGRGIYHQVPEELVRLIKKS